MGDDPAQNRSLLDAEFRSGRGVEPSTSLCVAEREEGMAEEHALGGLSPSAADEGSEEEGGPVWEDVFEDLVKGLVGEVVDGRLGARWRRRVWEVSVGLPLPPLPISEGGGYPRELPEWSSPGLLAWTPPVLRPRRTSGS